MTFKNDFILGFVLFVSLISCSPNQNPDVEADSLSDAQMAKIDSVCQSFIEKGNTIGFSVAIAHDGETVFSKGFGLANIESNKPATENTIYALASVSKFITAATTLKMAEEGKISLDDRVVDYFPDFPKQDYMDEITIEHLLRHQSGLVDHEDWFDSIYINERRIFEQKEFFDFLDQPLFFRPGTLYSYSNSGYAVLSFILEQVSDLSFHDIIVENIGKPQEMTSLGLWPNMWDHKDASMGYELADEGVDTSFHMMTKGMKGDGGLSASVVDLLKFSSALVDESLISKASLDRMLSPTPIGPISIDYGLGVKFGNINGQKTFGHSGGYKGTGWAMLAHYPESGFTFAALFNTNYSPEEAWMLRHFIMPIVLNIDPLEMDPSGYKDLELFTGEYASFNRWGNAKPSVRVIYEEEGKLYRDNPDTKTPGSQIYPIGNNSFSWKPYPYDEFKFHVVEGKVIACSEYIDGFFISLKMKK